MSAEESRAVVRRWVEEGWNGHSLAPIDELYAPDVVQHDPSSPLQVTSADGMRQYIGAFLTAFPDIRFTTDDLLAEGGKVLWRFTSRATHTAPLMGIPASGRSVVVTGMALFRVSGGRIAEVWVHIDALGLLQAIGAIPAMA